VRRDDQVTVLAWRERNGHGRRQSAVGTALVEHLPDGADVNGVVLEDFDESVFEGVGSYAIEQAEKSGRVAANILVALIEGAQEAL